MQSVFTHSIVPHPQPKGACNASGISSTNSFLRFDLSRTFDIVAGKNPLPQQRFTVHTKVLTERSEFFRAARSSRWLAELAKPVDLEDDDPEVFSANLECVYFGIEAIKVNMACDLANMPSADIEKDELTEIFTWSPQECQRRRDEQE